MPLQRIVLTGFMGSGKSTVGRLVARQLQWTFADLDDAVAERMGLPVPEIFAQHGEPAFRAAEVDTLTHLLLQPHLVLALGGGAPETPAVQTLLRNSPATLTVHLHAPLDVLYARCVAQSADPAATSRPLLGSPQAAAERFERRLAVYAAVAQHVAHVHPAPPDAVADEIVRHLRALSPAD